MNDRQQNNGQQKNRTNKIGHRGHKHNNKKNFSNKKRNPQSASAGASSSASGGSSRNRRPKSLTPSRILQKYENLMEQHLIARKKYFEIYGRITGKQFEKVESNFNTTLTAISDFLKTLKDWQKEILDKKLNFYPEDRQYSSTHNLEPVGESVDYEGDFEDPHLLPTQKNHQWSHDTEESVGTYEDYKKYKGL